MRPLKIQRLFILIVACFILFTCKKDVSPEIPAPPQPPPPTPASTNLVSNPSFENNGNPSLKNWYWLEATGSVSYFFYPIDSALKWGAISYMQDAPSGGGNWSVLLDGSYGIFQSGSSISYIITGQSGTNIYKVTAWAKAVKGPFACTPGNISFGKFSYSDWMNSFSNFKSVPLDTTLNKWEKYSLTDTLTTTANDTIVVWLHVGCLSQKGQYLFDLIDVEKTGP